ncbi:MAG: DoxX family protein [Luteolibacter sp.]|jgi:putative oxidoreductase
MKRILFDCGTRDASASLGLLWLRVTIGLMMMLGHGIPKLLNFKSIVAKGFPVPDFFPLKWMSPSVSLAATIGAEVLAAALIVLGLLTRPAAFVLGFTMVVAAFSVLSGAPWFLAPGVSSAKEPALLYLVPMIAIILAGPGGYSLDASIYKDGKRRRW